jgi:hypothetical protein
MISNEEKTTPHMFALESLMMMGMDVRLGMHGCPRR